MELIKFKSTTQFLGRNGICHNTGLHLTKLDGDSIVPSHVDCILIAPVTSRDVVGRCFIEVPVDAVDALIDALKRLK